MSVPWVIKVNDNPVVAAEKIDCSRPKLSKERLSDRAHQKSLSSPDYTRLNQHYLHTIKAYYLFHGRKEGWAPRTYSLPILGMRERSRTRCRNCRLAHADTWNDRTRDCSSRPKATLISSFGPAV